jgi:hypothetical protein
MQDISDIASISILSNLHKETQSRSEMLCFNHTTYSPTGAT